MIFAIFQIEKNAATGIKGERILPVPPKKIQPDVIINNRLLKAPVVDVNFWGALEKTGKASLRLPKQSGREKRRF
ncbi:MAG: hypothetical protein AB7U29_04930 [Desulfobulbus sp.]